VPESIELKVVENRIPELVIHVNAVARAAVKRTADDIARTMADLAPKDTGDMADSIESVSVDVGMAAGVQIGVDYWMYPNYGTRYQAAQPFVEPAVDMHQEELPALILVGIREF
jgi:HK97 gp10 family phage protein